MSVTILCYHKVGPSSTEGRKLNIEPSRLRSHVRFFAKRNQRFVVAGDLAASFADGIVCFTFDDAYASTMVHAPQIFEEVGARATFYAVPGRVGGLSDWDGSSSRPLADWDLLLSAQSAGHEIGNHSQNHLHLAALTPEDQLSEIESAHSGLLARGIRPQSFCFPYGSFNDITLDCLKSANYSVGLALGKRLAHAEDNLLCLPRIVVAYSDALPMLLYKLTLKPKLKRLAAAIGS